MKNYILIKGKLAIKRKSFLDKILMLIPAKIGYYQIIRIGREVDWGIFNWNGKKNLNF